MRISTAGLYAQGLQNMQVQQQRLSRTQLELVSLNKLQRAADNPAGMAQAQRLDHALATLEQNDRNAGLLEHRLNSQESALTDVGGKLLRARELAVQANSPALSPSDRSSIADELRSIRSEILDIANRDDGSGRRLFAGTRDGILPFADAGGTIAYAGDDGRNLVEVAPDLSLADTDAGSDVFMRMRTGDGVVRGKAAAGNLGAGVLQATSITDHAAWGGGTLRVEFTTADSWRVLDAQGAVLGAGAYSPGDSIAAAGMRLRLTGAPAAGDAFVVEPAPVRDIFSTLQTLADALDAPTSTAAEGARRNNAVGAAISDLGVAQDHMLGLRSATGTRLAALDGAADTRSATDVSLSQSLSELRDVDFAEAASRLAMQLSTLEAAQKTMLRMQTLSLFDRM